MYAASPLKQALASAVCSLHFHAALGRQAARHQVEGNQAAVDDGLAEHVGFGRSELGLGVQKEEESRHAEPVFSRPRR
jgi:hypothetical protein